MKVFGLSLMLVVALSASTVGGTQAEQITAREVVAQIQKHVGVEWQKDTVDTFKAGNPDATVKGIAVRRCKLTSVSNLLTYVRHPVR